MWFFLHKFFFQDMRPHKVSILKLLEVKKPEHPFVGTDFSKEPCVQSSIETILERFRKCEFLDLKLQRGHCYSHKESFREDVFTLPDWQLAPWVLQAFSRFRTILSKYVVAIVIGSMALGFLGGLGYALTIGCSCNQPKEVIQLPEQCRRTDQ